MKDKYLNRACGIIDAELLQYLLQSENDDCRKEGELSLREACSAWCQDYARESLIWIGPLSLLKLAILLGPTSSVSY